MERKRRKTVGKDGKQEERLLSAAAPPAEEAEQRQDEQAAASVVVENESLQDLGPSVGFYLNLVPGLPENEGESMFSVTIDQILCGDIKSCFLFNFEVDLDFVFRACIALHSAESVDVVHGFRDPGSLAGISKQASQFPNVKLHKPDLPIPFGTHHSKIMIAIYEAGVRICIGTANLIPQDWLFKTQGLWIRDFPLKSSSSPQTRCYRNLKAAALMSKYDFSSANCVFVASAPGIFQGKEMNRFGHMRIRHLLSSFRFPPSIPSKKEAQDPQIIDLTDSLNSEESLPSASSSSVPSKLVFQFSSIGSLTEDWVVNELGTSFGGGNPHLIWPTVAEVRDSLEGYIAGGSLCLSQKNLKPFLRKRFHKWSPSTAICSHRGRVMPHIKSYLRTSAVAGLAFFCLTSSNLSKAAWGALQKKNSQLMIRSYEAGVLFCEGKPLKPWNFSCTEKVPWESGGASCSSGVLKAVSIADYKKSSLVEKNALLLPVPYNPQIEDAYSIKDSPWDWDTPQKAPDVHGNTWK